MFGGLAFMINGNMFCGVVHDDLMVRVGPDGHESALTNPGARPMDMTGRPSKGMVFVGPTGYDTDQALRGWVEEGFAFTSSLPPKQAKKAKKS
jgi:hypothetical protein